ncbi:hypothetical protein GCM10020295_72350 [Streptomyces cinereospinus]
MFFVCGEMAAGHPGLLTEMAEDGHVVGNHTWSHPLLTRLSRAAVRTEMESTSDLVEEVCGARPLWFRAPYGAWNRAAFQLGAELGMEPLAWTVDTLDWTEPGTRTIVDRVEGGAGPGVVVLAHDAGGATARRACGRCATTCPTCWTPATTSPCRAGTRCDRRPPARSGPAQRTSTRRAKTTTLPS